MIITLKGADFSSSNVGTLDSWLVSTSLTGMTTDNTTKYVKKGESYTATFTEKDGYDLDATIANSQVFTMGGVDMLTLTNADG